MNELVRRFNNSDLSINLTSILILNNETNEFEPWFIAKEVATLLGYTDTAKAVRTHVDELDSKTLNYNECKELLGLNIIDVETVENEDDFGPSKMDTPNNSPKINANGMKFINESGLYTLIARSNKPEARKFQRWVTSEVLPSIRKTGSYNVQQQQQTPSYIIEDKIKRATVWIEEQKYALQLEAEKERLALENKTLETELTEVSEQRDKAIKTKAYINDKRTASLMGKVSGQSKKITKLEGELDTVNHQKALVESKLDVILSNMYSVDAVYHRVENLFHTGYQPSTLRSKLRKELNRISYMFGEAPKIGVNRGNPEHNPPKYYTERVVEQIIENGKNDPMYFKRLKG